MRYAIMAYAQGSNTCALVLTTQETRNLPSLAVRESNSMPAHNRCLTAPWRFAKRLPAQATSG